MRAPCPLSLCCDLHPNTKDPSTASQKPFPTLATATRPQGLQQLCSCSVICAHLPGPALPTWAAPGRQEKSGSAGSPCAGWRLIHVPRMDNEPQFNMQKSQAGSVPWGSFVFKPAQHLEIDPCHPPLRGTSREGRRIKI